MRDAQCAAQQHLRGRRLAREQLEHAHGLGALALVGVRRPQLQLVARQRPFDACDLGGRHGSAARTPQHRARAARRDTHHEVRALWRLEFSSGRRFPSGGKSFSLLWAAKVEKTGDPKVGLGWVAAREESPVVLGGHYG